MPSRRRPSVPAQPTPTPSTTRRRHRHRNRRHNNSSQTNNFSASQQQQHGHTRTRQRMATTSRTTTQNQPSISLLDLPDDVLYLIFLHVLDAPDLQPTLRHHSLDNWEYAVWIGYAHPKLYHTLANIVRTLYIHGTDSATPDEVSIIAPSLQHLTIDWHSRASRFLQALCDGPKPPPRLSSLNLTNVEVPPDLFNILFSAYSPPSLKSLTLSFVAEPGASRALTSSVSHLSRLRTLRLHGLSSLTGNVLSSICRASGNMLETLSLQYLRHDSVTDDILVNGIAPFCPNISDLDLEHLTHVSAHALFSFCFKFAPSLIRLRLANLPLFQKDIHEILRHAIKLQDLSIDKAAITDPEFLACVISGMDAPLSRLNIRGIYALTDADMSCMLLRSCLTSVMVTSTSSSSHKDDMLVLQAMTIRNSPLVGDSTCELLASTSGIALRYLDLRGCIVSDRGLHHLARECTQLTDIALGSDGTRVPWHDAPLYRVDVLSDEGFEELFSRCGKSLRTFFWETPRAVIPVETGPIRFDYLGVEHLHARKLANALSTHCVDLRRVEINFLRPPSSQATERAAADLAFFDLDQRHQRVVVFLDRDQL